MMFGKMNKAIMNFWLDVAIGIMFLTSAISGLVFLLPTDFASGSSAEVLGMSYRLWNEVHTWSSLAMVAGVIIHLALHWKWIVAMSKRTLQTTQQQKATTPSRGLALENAHRQGMNRRDFLYMGGIATAVVAVVAAGYKSIIAPGSAATSGDGASDGLQTLSLGQPSGNTARVSCPFGIVNDPYPGRCRHYLDTGGDGICDYSAPDETIKAEGTTQEDTSDVSPLTDHTQPLQQVTAVACPFGIVDDPYPGRCRRYTDADGDGICDYSVNGSGDVTSGGSPFGGGRSFRRGSPRGQP